MKKIKLFLIFMVLITNLSLLFASDANGNTQTSQPENSFTLPYDLLRDLFEVLFFLLFIAFIIWFIRSAWKSSRSLNILPIVNETGDTGEFDGIAAGIDDVLMANLQKINRLENSESIKSNWTASPQMNEREKGKLSARTQEVDVVGSGLLMNVQQLGDISLGPIKIPLGALLLFVLNIFGGKNLSGALQKYGKVNTIVLRLETRLSILSFGKSTSTRYFEVSWPSETIDIEHLSEGVPIVVEELAYKIILSVGKEIGTEHWTAYKWFLKGYIAFNDFDKNETRKDRLSDAIECYRESVYIDPYFAKAHYNLGVALDRMGGNHYDDAVFRYKQAISLAPDIIGAEAHSSLAKIYWDFFKDSDKALNELEKAEKFNKGLPDIYNLKGLIYMGKGEKAGNEKAVDWFKKAIDRCHDNPKSLYYYNTSVAYYYLEKYPQAQVAGEKALKILEEQEEKKHRDLMQTLGMIHLQKALTGMGATSEEYQKALRYFEEGLKMQPDNRDMLDAYGESLRETGKLDEALVIQRRLIRLWPEYSRGYGVIAITLSKLERYEDEIEVFNNVEELLKTDDKNKIIDVLESEQKTQKQTIIYKSVLGGYYLYVTNEYEKAVDCYKNIVSLELELDAYLMKPEILHNYGLALKYKRQVEQAVPILELAQEQYDESQVYDKAKCYTDLAFSLDESNDKTDKTHICYQQASMLYEKAGLFQLASMEHVRNAEYIMSWRNASIYPIAAEECDKAIRLDSNNASAYHAKGNISFKMGDDTNAIAQYEKAVELNYNQPGAHYNLGLSYYYTKEYEKAEKAFTTSIKLSELERKPEDTSLIEAYEQLFKTFEKQAKWAEAVKRFRKVVNLAPKSSNYQICLGRALAQCNAMDEAAEAYRTVLINDKDNHIALYHLADIYAEQGANINEAYHMAKSALKIKRELLRNSITDITLQESKQLYKQDKELAEINNTLGWLYYQKNQTEKARLLLEKSLSHNMSNPKWHARLAYAYGKEAKTYADLPEQADLFEKAKRQWEIVLDLDEGNLKQTAKEQLKLLSLEAE